MSCGRPVIASDIKGINDVIVHKESGYLCTTGKDSIRDAIMEVTTDQDLQIKLGANARKFIEENYDLGKIILGELSYYKNHVK